MNIHYLQHVPFEGLGSIRNWAEQHGHVITCSRLYQGEQLPPRQNIDWLIVMGGPMGIYDDNLYPWLTPEKQYIQTAIHEGKRVLGICLGAQLIADALGAKVYPNPHREIGWFPIRLTEEAGAIPIFAEVPSKIEAFHWHGDTFDLPQDATWLAKSDACKHQAFIYEQRVVALQFHLETTRQNAEQLITHCQDEMIDAPYIQTPEMILSDDRRFERSNQFMWSILDQMGQQQ